MATYYTRPRQPTAPSPAGVAVQRQPQHIPYDEQLPSLDSSTLASSQYTSSPIHRPSHRVQKSSLFSTPTDLPSSVNSSISRVNSRQWPRGRHHASSFSAQTSSSRSGSASTGASSYLRVHRSFSPTTPTDTDLDAYVDGDIEVELWDWSGESSEPDSWVLEEEVQRASRWKLANEDTHIRGRSSPLRGSPSTAHAAASCGSGNEPAPQPRIRIPLLSFFAALLSLDLDDPALRLLTQAAPPDGQSILFPGHSARCIASSEPCFPLPDDSETDPAKHSELRPDPPPGTYGLHKLLSSTAEPAGAAFRSLRAGFAIPIEVDVPGVTSLAGLFRAVGEVYQRSGQAWKEVWVGA
ncbi:hypothetical protein DAEQUDRAFT_735075 [Daedalea quercina L-15889]|uniref:Uncharacterized protein n=1 Tax=Daedalea quercina L-15889 TaxID=1314783 RepID=A0A165TNX1_9APHY|nr:hypothetical protein DAEQUDRAFT_735075 [Daedalea quercina L-15889]